MNSTTSCGSTTVTTTASLTGTFHRRDLPPPSIAFGAVEGKQLFKEALQEGNMESYFLLAEHYTTQGHPAFCSLGSLTMALNALLIDPNRVWQGVWRWFDESMLDCCSPLDAIKLQGLTLAKANCLATCHGAQTIVKYGNQITIDEFRQDIKYIAKQKGLCYFQFPSTDSTSTSLHTAKTENLEFDPSSSFPSSSSSSSQFSQSSRDTTTPSVPSHSHGDSHTHSVVMIVSYNRNALKQSGTGHFSPIGGYHEAKDMVLILDVARFKYPPHWVPLTLLFDAFQGIDPESGKSRGYVLMTASEELLRQCACCDSQEMTQITTTTKLQEVLQHECVHCQQGGKSSCCSPSTA